MFSWAAAPVVWCDGRYYPTSWVHLHQDFKWGWKRGEDHWNTCWLTLLFTFAISVFQLCTPAEKKEIAVGWLLLLFCYVYCKTRNFHQITWIAVLGNKIILETTTIGLILWRSLFYQTARTGPASFDKVIKSDRYLNSSVSGALIRTNYVRSEFSWRLVMKNNNCAKKLESWFPTWQCMSKDPLYSANLGNKKWGKVKMLQTWYRRISNHSHYK